MTERILAWLVQLITHVISVGGYAGIAGLITLNSGGIPIPSEVILPFSGYLVYLGRFNLFLVAAAGVVGCNVGSAIAYWIGAKGGRPLVMRYGKWVLMSQHDLDRMSWFFARYGSDRDSARAHAAGGADVRRLSGWNCPDGPASLSRLHNRGFLHLVLLPGMDRHEAGTRLGIRILG